MTKPIKRSVAVVIQKDGRVLAVRRSESDDELPGIWGLPAGSFRESETVEALIRRIGKTKLGVSLSPVREMASARQDRAAYQLDMQLWEVEMVGVPSHPEWQWAERDLFKEGQARGSLCCDLLIDER